MNTALLTSLLAIVLALGDVIADGFIKKAGEHPGYIDWKWLVVGTLIYLSTVAGWFFVMRSLKLATIGVLYGVSCILFLVIAGTVFLVKG